MSELTELWHPSATLEALRQRDAMLRAMRRYFTDSGSMEVHTPALSTAATTDPYLESYSVDESGQTYWLHTSPEFPMKRIIAAYATDIHQFATVFRREEAGRNHNREFVMLEWYRMQASLEMLIQDAEQLVTVACKALQRPVPEVHRVSYQDSVKAHCGDFPHRLTTARIAAVFAAKNRSFPSSLLTESSTVDDALTLFIDEFVVPAFDPNCLTVLYDYPASQASLATLSQHAAGHAVAERAELFMGSVELANGFHELTNAAEQQRRFEADNQARVKSGQAAPPIDHYFLAALAQGLPNCAGMALGIDRLLMVLAGYSSLDDVMTFPAARA